MIHHCLECYRSVSQPKRYYEIFEFTLPRIEGGLLAVVHSYIYLIVALSKINFRKVFSVSNLIQVFLNS